MQDSPDLQFLTQYEGWPHYPWCPVTRGDVMGCVFWNAPVVYLRNVWDQGGSLDNIEQVPYGSLVDLVRDGWRVD